MDLIQMYDSSFFCGHCDMTVSPQAGKKKRNIFHRNYKHM